MNLPAPIVYPGQYRILYPDGRDVLITGKPTLEIVRKLIGGHLETVTLSRDHWQVMAVGDYSAVDGSAPNVLATELCRQWQRGSDIFGVAVIVHDHDFGKDDE